MLCVTDWDQEALVDTPLAVPQPETTLLTTATTDSIKHERFGLVWLYLSVFSSNYFPCSSLCYIKSSRVNVTPRIV